MPIHFTRTAHSKKIYYFHVKKRVIGLLRFPCCSVYVYPNKRIACGTIRLFELNAHYITENVINPAMQLVFSNGSSRLLSAVQSRHCIDLDGHMKYPEISRLKMHDWLCGWQLYTIDFVVAQLLLDFSHRICYRSYDLHTNRKKQEESKKQSKFIYGWYNSKMSAS